jgi:hypothetical protein
MRFHPGFILLLLLISACTAKNTRKEPFVSLLKPCTEVTMVLYNGGEPLNFKTTDSSGLKILTEMITGETEHVKDTCLPAGEMYYLNQTDSILKVQFAARQEGNREVCNYVAYVLNGTSYKHKLSEKGKLLLSQLGPKP